MIPVVSIHLRKLNLLKSILQPPPFYWICYDTFEFHLPVKVDADANDMIDAAFSDIAISPHDSSAQSVVILVVAVSVALEVKFRSFVEVVDADSKDMIDAAFSDIAISPHDYSVQSVVILVVAVSVALEVKFRSLVRTCLMEHFQRL